MTPVSTTRPQLTWGPDLAIGVGLGVLTIGDAIRRAALAGGFTSYVWPDVLNALVVGGIIAVAAALHRRSPGTALMLVAAAGIYQFAFGVPFSIAEIGVAVVAYGCGRWGSAPVLWTSALAMPIAAYGGYAYAQYYGIQGSSPLRLLWRGSIIRSLTSTSQLSTVTAFVAVGLLGLAVPWLLGIALRFRHRADVTEVARQEAVHDAEQAQQIAELKEQQADLARDVHDVVGHSLAVILAQAEAAQFRDDADHESLQQSMRDIAAAARGSLRDVRTVLNRTTDTPVQTVGSLDSLIDGVRASGHEVADRVVGMPRPLPPELDVICYRVLQEMLTNAIKHGRRDTALAISRDWTDGLRIEVANETTESPGPSNHGLAGMRRRLDGVGGSLTVHHEGDRFVASAWIPVRPR